MFRVSPTENGGKAGGLLPRTYKMQWREDFSTQSKHFSEFVNFYKRGKDEGKVFFLKT